MENIEKQKTITYFYGIEKSYIDEEKKCIHVPIKNGDHYFEVGAVDQTARNVERKYSNLKFTGKRDIPKDKEEIIFFFQ